MGAQDNLRPHFFVRGARIASLGARLTAPIGPRVQKRANMSTVAFLVTARIASNDLLAAPISLQIDQNAHWLSYMRQRK